MSLRLRITLLCVALVAVVLAGFAITVNFLASTRIYGSLDDGLEAQANSILATLPPGTLDEALIESSRQALETEEAAGLLFQMGLLRPSALFVIPRLPRCSSPRRLAERAGSVRAQGGAATAPPSSYAHRFRLSQWRKH